MPRPKRLPVPPPRKHERAHGEGTIREVRLGVWRAWRARVTQPDGSSVRPSRTFYGPSAAESAALWAKGDQKPTTLLLGHWLDRWLALRTPVVRPASARNYRAHVALCASLALRPLDALTSDDWQQLANDLLAILARTTVVNWRGAISGAMRAAVKRGHLARNPLADVVLPKPTEQPVKAWPVDEVHQLVRAARGWPHEALLWLLLGTGLRLGEARALERADIDAAGRTITVSKSCDEHRNTVGPTKSGRTRIVDVPDDVLPVLAAHLARLPASARLVFPAPRRASGPVSARSVQACLKRLCESAGVTPLPVHATRHTYATLALDAGVPIKEVSEQLGHASVATTARIYSHAVERQRRAANALGSVLSGAFSGPKLTPRADKGSRESV